MSTPSSRDLRLRRRALGLILLLGLVSLLADLTYEGARSVVGPYLGVLGAGAAVVATAAGLGEAVGYGLRLGAGILSDRTRRYWTLTLVGYAVNLLAVPALALAGRWEVAVALVLVERAGKALRTPARDVLLSHAARRVGQGWGFGLHEALDQVGALLGPLVVAGVLWRGGGYRPAFALLAAPALLALGTLVVARLLYPRPQALEPATPPLTRQGIPRTFWVYLLGAALVAAGTADFPFIAFHARRADLLAPTAVPLLYALAMGIDALAALFFGALFDRRGIPVLALSVLMAAPAVPLAFSRSAPALWAGVLLWGIGLGAQESVLRAAAATLVSRERRGTAFGWFHAGYGLAWFAGSALMGLLYARAPLLLRTVPPLLQLAGAGVFLRVGRGAEVGGASGDECNSL